MMPDQVVASTPKKSAAPGYLDKNLLSHTVSGRGCPPPPSGTGIIGYSAQPIGDLSSFSTPLPPPYVHPAALICGRFVLDDRRAYPPILRSPNTASASAVTRSSCLPGGAEKLTVPDCRASRCMSISSPRSLSESPSLPTRRVFDPNSASSVSIIEPLANMYYETLDDLDKVVGARCVALTDQCDTIRDSTLYHWWPARTLGSNHPDSV
jgi:hypothetical protein